MHRSTPGPVGTSCLTCKRRHKKCDQRRPICARCEEGDLECLGYKHHRKITQSGPPKPRAILPMARQKEKALDQSIAHSSILTSEQGWPSSETDRNTSTETTNTPTSSPDSSTPSILPRGSRTVTYSKDQHPSTAVTNNSPAPFGRGALSNLYTPTLPSLQQLFKIFSQIPRLPSNPTAAFLSSPQFDDYILTHFDQMMNYVYFKPIAQQKARFLGRIASRLRNSWISRWVALLDARICESLIADTLQPEYYNRWIRDLEVALLTMKAIVVPSSNAIQVLQSATPTFLQTAYACPELWSGNSDPTSIPLLNAVALNRHELACFALIDCTHAMVFGVPQQVDYDISISSLPNSLFSSEWAHSCPVEFLVLLAEINTYRDKGPGVRHWREIEHYLVTWLARPIRHDESWESWMAVAWLAVQESWRLTLLMYLYLAIGDASSDEPRVQLCVSQILQVMGTVRKHDLPDVTIPFFIQYLMAGICANRENHRSIVRKMLSNKSQTKFWRFRGADFVPVLDHLWHGVGCDGRPIKWCDYIHSRETMIPIAI
ncbi:unnamed protein product [Rhizoctonia solani]|uniref:Zn(2)-C6 fungal-type domain-containing protein n=1 Tax=Rhizoctonia solani TaxID=456999 RepID=A0A8H3HZ86_9AGAM|nr:unnamed protein product [Rhizoctonia solani]